MTTTCEPAFTQFGIDTNQAVIERFEERKSSDWAGGTTFETFKSKISSPSKKISWESFDFNAQPITSKYKEYSLRSLVKNIDDELAQWEKSSEPLIFIHSIKVQLDLHKEILSKGGDTRILLGLLELLFQNNNWAKMDSKAIKTLRSELKRFDDGAINQKGLSTFSKQLYRSSFNIFKDEQNASKESN